MRLNQWLGRSVLLSHLVREFYLGTGAKSLVGQVFASIANDVLQRGGKTIVLRIPTRDDDQAINRFRSISANSRPGSRARR
jgi:ribosomal protein L17